MQKISVKAWRNFQGTFHLIFFFKINMSFLIALRNYGISTPLPTPTNNFRWHVTNALLNRLLKMIASHSCFKKLKNYRNFGKSGKFWEKSKKIIETIIFKERQFQNFTKISKNLSHNFTDCPKLLNFCFPRKPSRCFGVSRFTLSIFSVNTIILKNYIGRIGDCGFTRRKWGGWRGWIR